MLTTLKRLLGGGRRETETSAPHAAEADTAPRALSDAQPADIERFLEAACRADGQGQSPWVLREPSRLETLRRALEFTVHRRVWLQRNDEGVAHWQGRLLVLKHGEGEPLGMLLACRPDDEAAWQLRFFFIEPPWQGSGHGARLLLAARRTLNGTPLQTRLPLACKAAIRSLETAGFQRMHINASEIVSFEAPAEWH
ncbi:hypothetical protein L861_06975 [Litchfieldella anticariensis FP35 = DSM 16096]|uniref:N-acetyltransferase domain-containing protein n=1 Tax=Litchfieldella anticariensis (strain DSM 16096 / CECT 5854 / CIP 108499 / LMG 22089 / FP35) TaxID=1121939 RepID=S2KEE6_LITA3|nr:GNAT family N-acetyltransferase [Halomonas anticariensis]EPC00230.1 hypothetical protein L861_06975 [Halomonas anticariensis FP35 = DSM 16096]